MRTWMLLLALTACGGFDYDEVVCGHLVQWNDQRDRDGRGMCETIRRCEDAISVEFTVGAEIRWVEDIPSCGGESSAAGCFYEIPYNHSIDLVYSAPIRRSALCHELLHWQLYLDGDADRAHKHPGFAVLDNL